MGEVNSYHVKCIIALFEATGYFKYEGFMPGVPVKLLFAHPETGWKRQICSQASFDEVQNVIYEFAYNHGQYSKASKMKEQMDIVFEINNK
jgi:hypothetical protein